MDELHKELKAGEYNCVSADDLTAARLKAFNMHISAFVILLYMQLHSPLWTRIASYCEQNKLCCSASYSLKVLKQSESRTLGAYTNQLKTNLRLLEDSKLNKELLAESDEAILQANHSRVSSNNNNQSQLSGRGRHYLIGQGDVDEDGEHGEESF